MGGKGRLKSLNSNKWWKILPLEFIFSPSYSNVLAVSDEFVKDFFQCVLYSSFWSWTLISGPDVVAL